MLIIMPHQDMSLFAGLKSEIDVKASVKDQSGRAIKVSKDCFVDGPISLISGKCWVKWKMMEKVCRSQYYQILMQSLYFSTDRIPRGRGIEGETSAHNRPTASSRLL